MACFHVTFREVGDFHAHFCSCEDAYAEFESVVEVGKLDYYDGPYEYTPTQSEQIVEIFAKTARENITINPIPRNYGRISYDGAILTVE